jgi:hypothetical protein
MSVANSSAISAEERNNDQHTNVGVADNGPDHVDWIDNGNIDKHLDR